VGLDRDGKWGRLEGQGASMMHDGTCHRDRRQTRSPVGDWGKLHWHLLQLLEESRNKVFQVVSSEISSGVESAVGG